MCGILGIVGRAADTQTTHLSRACELMRHRGPDDSGVFTGDGIALGIQRLAILDLTAAGHQPMISADRRVALVFNGEIYNFRDLRRQLEPRHAFRSETDSEVLLHGFVEWGFSGLLSRIEGMFAFAIWDSRARLLHAARDRMGKKPFYFSRTPQGLFFASTLNSLLELLPSRPELNLTGLDAYLTYQALPAPMTMFRGIEHLEPAHMLTFSVDDGGLIVRRYWDIAFWPKLTESEPEILEHTDSLLRAAIRKRLISDVPLGAFLSGGVDSSLVVSLMSQESNASVEAVVVGFDEPEFDERPEARLVARKWGVRLHEHVLRADALSSLPEVVWQYGQPVADFSIVPTHYVAKVAKRNVTVVLNGDGGDEVFGGYARPVVARAAEIYRRLPRIARAGLARALSGHKRGRLRRAWMLASAGNMSSAESFMYDRAFRSYRHEAYGAALKDTLAQWDPDELYQAVWERAIGDDVDRSLYGDFSTYLPDQLLVKMDVATMANSVEARSPLLDLAVVEYAAQIPTAVRLKNYTTKYVLKRIAERYLPREIIYRRKRGFVAPVATWMRRDLAPLLRAALESRAFRQRGWIEPAFVHRMLGEHLSGVIDWSEQLWTLFVLEIWARQSLDCTLARSDPLECLQEDTLRSRGSNASPPKTVRTLQIGMGWFDEEPGGLNRFYKELVEALPNAGVSIEGLIAGSHDATIASDGRIQTLGSSTASLLHRWRKAHAKAKEMLANDGVDLIVSHFALYTLSALQFVGDCPLVVHFQGPWALEGKVEGERWTTILGKAWVERAVYRRAVRFITLSRAFANVLHESYGVPQERIRVVPGAIDVKRFEITTLRKEARRVLGWPEDRPIVLSVRRLVHRMGLENLIDAVPLIRQRIGDVIVMIAGQGPIAAALRKRVHRLGVEDNVRLLGFVPDENLPLAYRAADFTIVPTVALEGFGLIVAESLAAGTPALVTPVSSLPEVVEGLARNLVLRGAGPAEIAEGLCSAIEGTIELPDAFTCQRFAREQYDWPIIASRIRDVYLESLQ